MPTLREVLVAAGRESRLDDATVALGAGGDVVPWYVKLAVGAGTWVGAFCVGFALVLSGIADSAVASMVVGLLLVGGAVFVSRATTWIASPQVVLVSSLGGQSLVLVHLVEGLERTGIALVFAAIQLVLLFAIRDSTHRFLSAASAVVAAWVALDPPYTVALVVPAVALAIAAELFLRDTALASAGRSGLSRPTAYGTAAAALGIHVAQALWGSVDSPRFGAVAFVTTGSVVFALAASAVGVRVAMRAGAESGWPEGRVRVATVVAALVTAAVSFRVPGLAVAFVLLVVAHARREVVLGGLTCTGIAVFFGVFYYSLDLPLLEKAAWIGGTGVVFLGLFALGFRHDGAPVVAGRGWLPKTREGSVAAATALATLLLVGGLATSREAIRRSGTRVLLPLAPVDPRSLVQGDYMELRYALTDEVASKLEHPRFANAAALVQLDATGVGSLVALDPARAPGANEALLLVRIRDSRARIGAESFFFEEGEAERYAEARFAELRVSSSGVVLLTALVDERLQLLGKPRE